MKRLLISLILCCLIVGCAGKTRLTEENFQRIKPGMNYQEAISILGKPDGIGTDTDGNTMLEWADWTLKPGLAYDTHTIYKIYAVVSDGKIVKAWNSIGDKRVTIFGEIEE